ncbi:MAG: DUF1294 domain-containing protein [Oscillospiraceae bacterium]|nr:DUF1294 domain-containing protein [Oscillospiraceae bacterium]
MIYQALCVYLAAINILLFALMGIDKWKAKNGRWRIPEKTLFLTAALGGSMGGILGMKTFRHKTRHNSFKYGFPAILIAQLALIGTVMHLFWNV